MNSLQGKAIKCSNGPSKLKRHVVAKHQCVVEVGCCEEEKHHSDGSSAIFNNKVSSRVFNISVH